MQTAEYEIPIPPSTNNLFHNLRNGGRRCTEQYRLWREDAAKMLLFAPRIVFDEPVYVEITLQGGKGFSARRRDADNFEKAIFDMLVKGGILPGDTLEDIPDHRTRYRAPAKKTDPARCIVRITSFEESA